METQGEYVKTINRPWWLPDEVDPKHIKMAINFGAEWQFIGNADLWVTKIFPSPEQVGQPSPFLFHQPAIIWDRCLTEEEVIIAYNALKTNDMDTVLKLKPTHVRYIGDLDASGTCRCAICQCVRKEKNGNA